MKNGLRGVVEDLIRDLQKKVAYGLPSAWGDVSVEGRASAEDFRRWYEQLERIERDATVLRSLMFKIWVAEERKEGSNV
jgi:hypothetical protein